MRTIALVTGASSGLGRAFARQLDSGALGALDEIWAVGRNEERLAALGRICSTPVRPFALDLTDPASFDALEKALAADLGERNVEDLVAAGADDGKLDFNVRFKGKQGFADVVCLPQGKLAAPGRYDYFAHGLVPATGGAVAPGTACAAAAGAGRGGAIGRAGSCVAGAGAQKAFGVRALAGRADHGLVGRGYFLEKGVALVATVFVHGHDCSPGW